MTPRIRQMIDRLPKGFPCCVSFSLILVPFAFVDGNPQSYVLSSHRNSRAFLAFVVGRVAGSLFLVGISSFSFVPS